MRNKENLPKKASEAARMAYNTWHITWEPLALHRTLQGEIGAVRKAHLCLNNQYILMSLTLQWITFLSSLWRLRNSTKYITPIFKLVIEIYVTYFCVLNLTLTTLFFLLIFSYCPELVVSLYPLIYYAFLWCTINLFLEIWHRLQVHSFF